MTASEYADYFVKNYIEVSGTTKTSKSRNGKIVTNGGASLTLSENEQEIKNITIQEDKEYFPDNPNEKQFIVDIYNETDLDFEKIRVNIYLGNDTKLLEISPSEIISNHIDNTTFSLPFWISLSSKNTITFYIIVSTKDENFFPEIVVAATE